MTKKKGDVETTYNHIEMECPCGGTAIYAEDQDGEPHSLLHTMPMCAQFESLAPVDYLKWRRTTS